MAALTASSVEQDSGTFSLAGTDWGAANGSPTLTRKATGGSTITLANIGSTTQNPAPGSGNFVLNYTDGPSGAGSATGIVYTTASTFSTANGQQLTLPADTSVRQATVYWGTSGTTGRLTATLSDGSAASATHTVASATDAQDKGFISTVQWQAGSASQTLTIKLTTDTAIDGNEQIAFQAVAYSLVATGAASSTQQPNVSAASGSVRVSGAAASTQAKNTSAASGAANVSGSASSTQAPNASNAAGAIGNVAQGSAASTQAANSSAATGSVSVSGSSASTQGKNTSTGAGLIAVSGSAASNQASNNSAASGSVPIAGASASTQTPNASAMSGVILVASSGASLQGLNASSASGVVSTPAQVMPTPLKYAYVQTSSSGIKMAAPVINSIAQFAFQIKQGSDLNITMTWLQDDGVTPVNLTGYAMKLEIRAYTGSPTALLTLSSANTTGSYIALGGTAGTISLIFAHADTAALSPMGLPTPGSPISTGPRAYQLGVYDLQFTDPTGGVGFLLEGSVSLDPQVTI